MFVLFLKNKSVEDHCEDVLVDRHGKIFEGKKS